MSRFDCEEPSRCVCPFRAPLFIAPDIKMTKRCEFIEHRNEFFNLKLVSGDARGDKEARGKAASEQ